MQTIVFRIPGVNLELQPLGLYEDGEIKLTNPPGAAVNLGERRSATSSARRGASLMTSVM